jgi:hypothetical protein
MKNCKKINKDLVAYLYGELEKSEKDRLEAHLKVCPECRKELGQLRKVYKGAGAMNEDIEKTMASIDWENLPSRIADAVFKQETSEAQKPGQRSFWHLIFQPRFRPVYAGLLLGILLGSVVTFLILRDQPVQVAKAEKILVPQGFYESMELEMARRETIHYLARSEYLLLDFVQAPPERSAEFWQSGYASRKAKDLLTKKKYLDSQLDKFQLAKAKAICDQIELLFFELMQISDQLSPEDLQKIQRLIADKQLLLKIKLVKKELEKSEV